MVERFVKSVLVIFIKILLTKIDFFGMIKVIFEKKGRYVGFFKGRFGI